MVKYGKNIVLGKNWRLGSKHHLKLMKSLVLLHVFIYIIYTHELS